MLIFSVFCQNYQKFCFKELAKNSSLIGDISELFSKFTTFPGAIFSGGRDKACFCISRDHMINESRDSVCEIPSP